MRGSENRFLPPIETPAQKEVVEMSKKEKLFGHCFRMNYLESGDLLPVGGNFLEEETSIEVEVDVENFQGFIADTGTLADAYKLDKLRNYLDSAGLTLDERLFADVFAFTKNLESTYPLQDGVQEKRRGMYSKRGDRTPKLSEAFESGATECAEIAALAQLYLQARGCNQVT